MENIRRPKSPTVSSFRQLEVLRCQLTPRVSHSQTTDRQTRIEWWNQKKIHAAKILLVGLGGLGSNQAKIFAQMQVGQMHGIDHDLVEYSNLNRQLFVPADVGKPKAHRLLANLKRYAAYPTWLRGYYMRFEEWTELRRRPRYHVVCCGVDDLGTMASVARYGLQTSTPVVFTNVSGDGEGARVFIQRSGGNDPCFACYMPNILNANTTQRNPCIPVPAIADILQVAVGFGARATVGEILGVPIGDYNCRDITFTGFDVKKTVAKRFDCPLCGGNQRANEARRHSQ